MRSYSKRTQHMKMKTIGILIICLNISTIVIALNPAPNPPPNPPNCRSFIDYTYYAVIKILDDDDEPCGDTVPVIDGAIGFNGSILVFDEPVNGISFDTHLTIIPRIMGSMNGGIDTGSFKLMELVKQIDDEPLSVIVSASITHNKIDGYALVVDAQDENGGKSISLNINQIYENFDLKISWVNTGCVNTSILCPLKNGQVVVEVDGIDHSIVGAINKLYYRENNNNNAYWKASAVYWGELGSQNFNSNVNFVDPGY
jgi:hypothetical protein